MAAPASCSAEGTTGSSVLHTNCLAFSGLICKTCSAKHTQLPTAANNVCLCNHGAAAVTHDKAQAARHQHDMHMEPVSDQKVTATAWGSRGLPPDCAQTGTVHVARVASVQAGNVRYCLRNIGPCKTAQQLPPTT